MYNLTLRRAFKTLFALFDAPRGGEALSKTGVCTEINIGFGVVHRGAGVKRYSVMSGENASDAAPRVSWASRLEQRNCECTILFHPALWTFMEFHKVQCNVVRMLFFAVFERLHPKSVS